MDENFRWRLRTMLAERYTWAYVRDHFGLSDEMLRNAIREAFPR